MTRRAKRDPDWFPKSEWEALRELLKPWNWAYFVKAVLEELTAKPRVGDVRLRTNKPPLEWDGKRWKERTK